VPAAAVIPAPIAYTKVVAVKKLVVGCVGRGAGRRFGAGRGCTAVHPREEGAWHSFVVRRTRVVYCEKIRVFKAGRRAVNT
jgi:hypothetical protein